MPREGCSIMIMIMFYYHYDFLVDNKSVDTTETLKILGVTLDRKLNFKNHVKEQVKKACAKATALRRVRKFIPMDVMGRLYKRLFYRI